MTVPFRRPPVRRAVVLFPSGLTLLNLFFGVFAIITASRGDYSRAALWVVCGAIADAFDGRVARATGTGGKFGEELDSLVDAITFGLAPSLIVYFAVLNRDNWSWVWAFLFTACAVLRLARFNVAQAGVSKRYFQGLPSPAAGITLATYFWFSQSTLYTDTIVADWPWHQLIRVVMGVLSFLMISNVPYPVVPKLSLRSVEGWAGVAFLVGGVSMLVTRKFEWFFPLATAYILIGLLRGAWLGWIERRTGRRQPGLQDEDLLDLVEEDEDIEAADIEYERVPSRRAPRRRLPPVAAPPARAVSAPPTAAAPVSDAGSTGEEREQARRRRRRRKPRRPGDGSSTSTDTSSE